MQNNRTFIIVALIIAVIVVAGAWYISTHPASSPSASNTATTTVATSTTTTTPITSTGATSPTPPTPSTPAQPVYATNSLPVSSKDTLVSWSFKGSYEDGGTLQQKATSQIATLQTQLKNQLSTNDPMVQETYISIAEEYELLGDGQTAYNYFLQALNSNQRYIQEDGMAWAGLGDLMQRLHAYYTAATAYANAVAADPGEPSFHVARIQFLTTYLPKETASINAAFADANKDVPGDASVAQLQAQYKAQTQ